MALADWRATQTSVKSSFHWQCLHPSSETALVITPPRFKGRSLPPANLDKVGPSETPPHPLA